MEIREEHSRLIVSVSKDEAKELIKKYQWKLRKDNTFSLEDNWVHRLILGLDIKRREYVAQQDAVDRLFEFQKRDVIKLCKWGNALNGNAMGLGKTIESLAFLKLSGCSTAVVFTKKIVISHWEASIKEWFPGLRVFCFTSTKQKLPPLGSVDVIITNYEKLLGKTQKKGSRKTCNLSNFGEYLCGRLWDCVIADEAHYIKNINSIRHILICRIPSKFRQALTGTPIKNHADDLYGILHWVEHEAVGRSYWSFVDYFCNVDNGPFGRKIQGLTKDVDKQNILKDLLSLIMVRNSLEDVLPEMPEVQETLITVDMDEKQRKLYKNIQDLLVDDLPETCTIQNGMIKVIRLQQANTCPEVLEPNIGPGAKFEFIGDWLESEEDLRIIIFSPFATPIKHLQKYLNSRSISCKTVHGCLSDKQRTENIEQFKNGDVRVLACTIGAAGTGTDGLQISCHTVLFLERDWSPEEMRQAISRVRRIGQKEKVHIYYLECDKSVDQHIGKINISKISDIRKIVEGKVIEKGEEKYAYNLL